MSRLITIPVSHFCEKARWALDLSGAPYVEEGHAPVAHRFRLARLRATTAPAFICDDGTILRESSDIVRHADELGDLGLFGDTPAQRRDVASLMARFDERVGPQARLLVWGDLLDEPAAFLQVAGTGLRPGQQRALRATRPAVAGVIRRFFGVSEESRRRAEAVLEEEAARADERRAGAPYLVGDRFTAADLTFAALLAPLVQAEGYGGGAAAFVAPVEELPPRRRSTVESWRARPSGRAVTVLYAAHRQPSNPPVSA